jgi:hypothetical protein
LLILAAASAALSACVVAPYPQRQVYAQPAPAYPAPPPANDEDGPLVEAPLAPPAPYAEVIPVMPFAGAVWINGYWGWNAGRHVWIGGRWDRPRPGFVWEPHRWVAVGGRWHLRGGWWRKAR